MAIRITHNGMKALLERATRAKKTLIRAGVFAGPTRKPEQHRGQEPEPTEMTNAEVAAIHEFGLGDNHERSFVRATVDANRTTIEEKLRALGGSVVNPRSASDIVQGAKLFGEWFVGEMKRAIREGIDPPLEAATIAAKGSSTPLIDSGQLLASLTYDVAGGK